MQIARNNSDDANGADSADTQIFPHQKLEWAQIFSLPESRIGADKQIDSKEWLGMSDA